MSKVYSEIDGGLRAFIEAQHLFFVATAPSGADGHVNCSPKGLDSFRILDPLNVAYVDFVGSGVETIAHVRQNGRIVLMFCAFQGPPKIVRLHGTARVIEAADREFESMLARMSCSAALGMRAIVSIAVTRVSDACGYGVPLYSYEGQRDQLKKWADRKGPAGIAAYKLEKNTLSIDALPGVDAFGREPE